MNAKELAQKIEKLADDCYHPSGDITGFRPELESILSAALEEAHQSGKTTAYKEASDKANKLCEIQTMKQVQAAYAECAKFLAPRACGCSEIIRQMAKELQ